MPKLTWISDKDLSDAVVTLLQMAKTAKRKAGDSFGRNVVDPFSAIFEMVGFATTYDEWIKSEEARQAQKTLQNFVGSFHQIILGSCKGWVNLHSGNIVDLLNTKKRIIAEVKNKYNTIPGGKLADLYWSLDGAVMNKTSVYKNYTAYYVTIIPKNPKRFDMVFIPSDNKKGQKCPANPLIRHIDGASFYELVTGKKNALEDLFDVLPDVISKITKTKTLNKRKLKALFEMAYG